MRRVGTILVVEGADQYVRDTDRASDSTDKLTKTIKGVGLIAAGMAVGRMFVGMGRDAMQATAAHEQLQMSMTSLVTKELRTADATLSMGDAMSQAGDRADELLTWIQDLAIISPFSQQGVAMAFRTGLAYGFTSEEAQRLTAATIDFATATGQNVGVMNQVALALGQIKAKGKLAGQEILQLVNAGFAVKPVIEGMGFQMADVSKGLVKADEFLEAFTKTLEDDFGGAAARSAGTINGLLDSLGDLKQIGLRELFGPAIQATLPLLSGMVDKVQELMPAIRTTGLLLADLTKFLIDNKDAFLVGAVAVGVFWAVLNAGTILTAVTAGVGLLTSAVMGLIGVLAVVASPIGILALALGGIAAAMLSTGIAARNMANQIDESADHGKTEYQKMGESMQKDSQENADKAHGWGGNLVVNFAQGMADAISAVMTVLTDLGNALAHWLSPGSPPRILPDIDKWGTSAMDEFLGGMVSADFGVLQKTGSSIESYLTSADTGDGSGALARIRKMRTKLRGAMNEFSDSGSLSTGTLNTFDPAFRSYVDATFKAETANRKLIASQKELSEITLKYQNLLKPINTELDAIAARRAQVTENQRTEVLQNILSDKNAPALAKEMAALELREIELLKQGAAIEKAGTAEAEKAEIAITAAQKEAELANEQLAVEQALLAMRTQDNNLLKQQANLLNSVAAAVDKIKGGAAAVDPTKGAAASPAAAIKKSINQLLEDIKAPFAGIKDQWDQLKLSWALATLEMIARVAVLKAQFWLKFNEMKTNFIFWVISVKLWFAGLGTKLEKVGLNIIAGINTMNVRFGEIFGEEGSIRKFIADSTLFLTEQWGEGGVWPGIFDNMKTAAKLLKEKAFDTLQKGLNSVKTAAQNTYDALWNLKQLVATTDLSNLNPFISNSPAPLAVGLAQINKELNTLTSTGLPRLGSQSAAINVPASQSQVATNSAITYNQQSFEFGGNNINSGMDQSVFEAAVLRVVNGALG